LSKKKCDPNDGKYAHWLISQIKFALIFYKGYLILHAKDASTISWF